MSLTPYHSLASERSKDVWGATRGGYEKPIESSSLIGQALKQNKESVKKNATTFRYIQQGVSKLVFPCCQASEHVERFL